MFYHLSYFEVIYLDRYFKMMKVEVISNTKSLSFFGVFLRKRGWFFVMSGGGGIRSVPLNISAFGNLVFISSAKKIKRADAMISNWDFPIFFEECAFALFKRLR